MYKRHAGQLSMLESPEMFGNLPLNPKNRWIRMSRMIPRDRFDEKYAENFHSTKLKETSEVMIQSIVLFANLQKKLRLLLCLFFGQANEGTQNTYCSEIWAA